MQHFSKVCKLEPAASQAFASDRHSSLNRSMSISRWIYWKKLSNQFMNKIILNCHYNYEKYCEYTFMWVNLKRSEKISNVICKNFDILKEDWWKGIFKMTYKKVYKCIIIFTNILLLLLHIKSERNGLACSYIDYVSLK